MFTWPATNHNLTDRRGKLRNYCDTCSLKDGNVLACTCNQQASTLKLGKLMLLSHVFVAALMMLTFLLSKMTE